MTNPSDLVDNIVAALRAIPGAVSELGSDASRIAGYEDLFPGSLTISESINNMPNPSILVVYNGTATADYKKGSVWEHKFSLILKTKNAYTDLVAAIINGVPTGGIYGGTLKFRLITLHSSCDPINELSADRRQLFLSEYSSIDYWEVSFVLYERGLAA
jgi:hypothetical protein